jgi:hypothetical protein
MTRNGTNSQDRERDRVKGLPLSDSGECATMAIWENVIFTNDNGIVSQKERERERERNHRETCWGREREREREKEREVNDLKLRLQQHNNAYTKGQISQSRKQMR